MAEMNPEKRAKMAGITLPDIDEDQYEYSPVGHCEMDSKCEWQRWYMYAQSWRTELYFDDTHVLGRRPKKTRWRAEYGALYWTTSSTGESFESEDIGATADARRYSTGNYWRTREQAEKYAEECKKLADRLHEEFGE